MVSVCVVSYDHTEMECFPNMKYNEIHFISDFKVCLLNYDLNENSEQHCTKLCIASF